MNRLAVRLAAAVAALWVADAAAAALDPGRIAAIDKAAAAFVALGKEAYKTGAAPRQSDPQVDKLLATVCDTTGLNQGNAPTFAQIDALNDWLLRLTQGGTVYLLAGTGIADATKTDALDDAAKAKIAANTVAFAPEIGRYIDAELAVTQAEIAAILAHMTEDPPLFATAKARAGLVRLRTGLVRTLAGVVTTMPVTGLDPKWPAARIPALTAISPVAAAFLTPEDRQQLHDMAAVTAEKVSDKSAKAGLAQFAKTLAP